jgi:hypothetical protein
MKDSLKSFLNEEQDPKAIEKITSKLNDLLMKNEEIGYIGVQKKPAINVFPDSIVLTNKRIILCKPKNLGLSMDFVDYSWEDIAGTFVKENILGSEFSFATKTDIQISIDYIPKTQARKIYTYAKEQLELLKEMPFSNVKSDVPAEEIPTTPVQKIPEPETIEEMETEEVTNFADPSFSELAEQIIPVSQSGYRDEKQHPEEEPTNEQSLAELSSEALFDKLQNYKKLLDNGLILQGEYDTLKKEILSYM